MSPQAHQKNMKWKVTDLLSPIPTSHSHSAEVTSVNCIILSRNLLCVRTYTHNYRYKYICFYTSEPNNSQILLHKFKTSTSKQNYMNLICLLFFIFSTFFWIIFTHSSSEMLAGKFVLLWEYNTHIKEHLIS